MTDDTTTDGPSTGIELPDPGRLRDRDDVPVTERERTLDSEQFEGLRERYGTIDGVVMVGLTDGDGRVLLVGDDEVAPPGGNVAPGEDWAAAARRATEALTGVAVSIDSPELFGDTHFRHEADANRQFTATGVHFRASLAEPAPAFRTDPRPPEEPDHEFYDAETTLGWYAEVPETVHPNHEDHVALYFD